MNDNTNSPVENEAKISIADLFFSVLRHWRALIIFIVIGALLGSVVTVKSAKDTIAAEMAEEAALAQDSAEGEAEEVISAPSFNEDESEMDPEALAEYYGITDSGKQLAESAAYYRQYYQQQLNYIQKSVYLNMPADGFACATILYNVYSETQAVSIAESLKVVIEEQDVLQAMSDSIGGEIDAQYIRELISTYSVSGDIYGDDVTNIPVRFYVYYPDIEDCRTMAETLMKKIDGQKIEGVTFMSLGVSDMIDTNVSSKQKTAADRMQAAHDMYTSIEAQMTEDEKAYYEAVYLSALSDTDSDESQASEVEEASVPAENQSAEDENAGYETSDPSTSDEAASDGSEVPAEQDTAGSNRNLMSLIFPGIVKWVIIGACAMVLVWAGIFALAYLVSRKIHRPEEAQEIYNLNLIGCIDINTCPKKGIDRVIDNLAKGSRYPGDSREYLFECMKALPEQHVVINGKTDDTEAFEFLTDFTNGSNKLALAGSIHGSVDGLEMAKKSEAVVLAIHLGNTTYAELRREVEACRLHRIKILGVLGLR